MKRRHFWWALALACIIATPLALAQTTTTGTFTIQRFNDFLQSLPTPTSTLGANDKVPILQNGQTKGWAPYNYFLSRDGSNVSDSAAMRAYLGAMARDASDATLPTARTELGVPQFNPVKDHGADPTGASDAAAAVQASITDCTNAGGGVIAISGYRLLINSANLTVPRGCAIKGDYVPHSAATASNDFSAKKGALVVNPTYTISLSGALDGVLVYNKNLTVPTTYQTGASLVAGFSGTGITVADHAVSLRQVQVLGFATGFSSNGFAQLHLDHVFGDNTNCISTKFSHDQSAFLHVECWPFLTASQAWTTASSNISGAADNGSGKIRLTVASTANFATGNTLFVQNVGGFLGANTKCTNVTVVDATHVDCPSLSSAPAATASVVTGSNVITLTAADPSIHQGQTITDATTGGNIPGGATVTWVYDTTVYMSAAATGTGASDTINFANGAYTSGGTVTLDNNYRSGAGFYGENNTLLECVMCYAYGYSIGLDLLDEVTDTWAVNVDGNPTLKDPTSLGIRIRGASYASKISGAYVIAGVGLVGNSTALQPNNVSIARFYNVSPTYTPTIYLTQGVFQVNNSGTQQGTYIYTSNGITRAQYCGDDFLTHLFNWDGDAAYFKTTVCDGTRYAGGVARGSQVIQGASTNANVTAGSTLYFAGSISNAAEAIVRVPVASSGTFSNMLMTNTAAPGTGESQTFTLRVNGADTAVTCTISGAGRSCTDTTHTAALPAQGTYDFKVVATNNGSYVASQVQGTAELRRP